MSLVCEFHAPWWVLPLVRNPMVGCKRHLTSLPGPEERDPASEVVWSVRLVCWVRKNPYHYSTVIIIGLFWQLVSTRVSETLLRTFCVELWIQESHKFGTVTVCARLTGTEIEKLFGHGNNRNCPKLEIKTPRLQNETPVSQNLKSSHEIYSPFAVVRTDPFRMLSIKSKIPDISIRIQMERSVSVSSDRNIPDHP